MCDLRFPVFDFFILASISLVRFVSFVLLDSSRRYMQTSIDARHWPHSAGCL